MQGSLSDFFFFSLEKQGKEKGKKRNTEGECGKECGWNNRYSQQIQNHPVQEHHSLEQKPGHIRNENALNYVASEVCVYGRWIAYGDRMST